MSMYHHPESDEPFLRLRPTKVQEVLDFLDVMANANKMEDTTKKKEVEKPVVVDPTEEVTDRNFLVSARTVYDKRSSKKSKGAVTSHVNTEMFTFMRQIDMDDEGRIQARVERERVAENFRRLGNDEYRKMNFENALKYYTKGLDYVKDTPVLYVNRAICYIKLRDYTRSIMDCDYVLNKLDERNLRAWLYRAGAYKKLLDDVNYDQSIYQAGVFNAKPKDKEYIENFVQKVMEL